MLPLLLHSDVTATRVQNRRVRVSSNFSRLVQINFRRVT